MSLDRTTNYLEVLYRVLESSSFSLIITKGEANKGLLDEYEIDGKVFKTDRSLTIYYIIVNCNNNRIAEFSAHWDADDSDMIRNDLAKEVISELITSKLLDMSKTV